MAETVSYTLADDTWVPIAENFANVGIQVESPGVVELFLGAALPSPSDSGLRVSRSQQGTPDALSLSGLPSGANVYARNVSDDDMRLVVMRYGTPI